MLEQIAQAYPHRPPWWHRRLAGVAGCRIVEAFLGACRLGPAPRFVGWANLEAARSRGKGVLILTLHLGPYERALRHAARRLGALTVVARDLPRWVAPRVATGRRRSHVQVLRPEGAVQRVLARLAAGEVVVVVLDQNMPRGQGAFVPFLNGLANTATSLAWWAQRTGAPIVPVEPHFGAGGRALVTVYPSTEAGEGLVESTAGYTRVLEAMVRRYPGQWLWTHRRFKTRPPE